MAEKKKAVKKKAGKSKSKASAKKAPAKKDKATSKEGGETRGRRKVLTGLPDTDTEKRMRRALRAAGFELKACEQTVVCKASKTGYSAKLPNGETVDIPLEARKRTPPAKK